MSKPVKYSTILWFVCLVFFACEKKSDLHPVIEYLSCSKTLMKQNGLDSTFIRLSYRDNDGDFGSLDSTNVFIYDGRNDSLLITYMIPDLSAGQSGNLQEGELILCVKSPCCLDTTGYTCLSSAAGIENNLQFHINIIDRAGNQSNTIQTESVILECNY